MCDSSEGVLRLTANIFAYLEDFYLFFSFPFEFLHCFQDISFAVLVHKGGQTERRKPLIPVSIKFFSRLFKFQNVGGQVFESLFCECRN